MHYTALRHGQLFFDLYWQPEFATVVELGSYDVNGTLRNVTPPTARYIGLDLEAGPGVDVVVAPGTPLPFADAAVDAVVSSSAFEHDVCFWDTFLELARIVRAGGLIYLNAPSNFSFHRYPLDCWRFYPDAGIALMEWARRRHQSLELLESFNANPQHDGWSDFVAVFRKATATPFVRRGRIADRTIAQNIYDHARSMPRELERFSADTPDMRTLATLQQRVETVTRELADLRASSAAEIDGLRAAATAAAQRTQLLERQQVDDASALAAVASTTAQAEARIAALQAALDHTRHDLAATHASTSWRLTAPLRKLRGLMGS